jgi:hypothetical protein
MRKESKVKAIIKIGPILLSLVLLMRVASSKSLDEWLRGSGGSPPVITNSFASGEASHGHAWRIYLEANDLDGDMEKVVCFIDQPGSGHSSRTAEIGRGYEARFTGYLDCYISRPPSGVSELTELTLTIFIRDRRGNPSNRVVLRTAVSGKAVHTSPPAPFDAGGLKRLGGIAVRLFYPTE